MARLRGRPVENRWIGMRMSDPAIDLATLARGQGAIGLWSDTQRRRACRGDCRGRRAAVRAGALVVIDARVAPEYSRAVSSSLLKHLPAQK